MGNYETLNELLVTLFRDVMDIEQKVIITPEFKDITNNDMHVIEAIGIREPKNMSTVARAVSVTVGTLTIAINHLVKKGYVERSRSEEDRRVVLVSLSEKGEKAYFHHRMFHRADFYGNFISVYFEGRDMFFVCTVRSAGDQFRHFLSATDNRDAGIVHFCDDILAVIADIEFYAHRGPPCE